jgi:hypothetical protein
LDLGVPDWTSSSAELVASLAMTWEIKNRCSDEENSLELVMKSLELRVKWSRRKS